MQMTLDFSDELIHDFYQQVPENKRSSVIADLLKNRTYAKILLVLRKSYYYV